MLRKRITFLFHNSLNKFLHLSLWLCLVNMGVFSTNHAVSACESNQNTPCISEDDIAMQNAERRLKDINTANSATEQRDSQHSEQRKTLSLEAEQGLLLFSQMLTSGLVHTQESIRAIQAQSTAQDFVLVPYWGYDWSWGSYDSFDIVVAMSDSSDYALVGISPTYGAPFICGPAFEVIQNGIIYNDIKLETEEGVSQCGNIYEDSAFGLKTWSSTLKPDWRKTFTLVFYGVWDTYSINVPASVNKYKLTVNIGGSGSAVLTGALNTSCSSGCSYDLDADSKVTLTVQPSASTVFTGWSGACSGTATSCTVTMTNAQAVTANFSATPSTYALAITRTGLGTIKTVDSRGNTIICGGGTDTLIFGSGSVITLTATPADGYVFTGWGGGSCFGTDICTLTVNSAKTIVANFGLTNYALSINKVGNGLITSSDGTINCSSNCTGNFNGGTTVNLSATATDSSYKFSNWSGACSGESSSCSILMDANKNTTGIFTLVPTYTINATANPSIGGSVYCSANSVASGGSSSCTATPNSGYTFTGFSGDCYGTSCSLNNVTSNKTVTANFTAMTYSINATANPSIGGSVYCSANSVASGGSSSCTATPNSGYTFTGFSGDCYGTSCSLNNVTSNKTVTANFTAMTYSINATANPSIGGSVYCSANSVASGGSSNCTATPNSGYTFTGFSGDCYGTSCSLNNVTSNKTVTANFTAMTYSINATANPSIGGSVYCSANSVASGGSSSCTATPNSGYTFTGFSGDCYGTSCSLNNVTSNKTVTANFTAMTYSINATANPSIGGSVYCSANSVASGGSSNCTATPNSGYTFTGFSGDCYGTSCSLNNVTSNKTVTANFKLVENYTLNITKKGTGTGIITSTDSKIDCGTDCNENYTTIKSVILKAVADVGSTFTGWSGACTGSSTCTISMNATQNVTATFTATAVDLAITNMVIMPNTPIANGLFDIAITVKNFSKKALDAGSLTIWKSQSTTGTCGALGNARTKVGYLDAGKSRTLTAQLRVLDIGTYTARAFIDSTCITAETNETDNQMTKTYTVK
ncbi:hypothetical protein CKO09_02635 [Chromatium weissei]|nr:hypothetical protein [Chromatium weissei]